MNNRFSRLATGLLVVAVMVLTAGRCSAIYYGLGPSKDEWGLKYDVEVTEAEGDMVNVVFTLADEGRMEPIFSIELVAFSKQTDSQGGRSYDLKAPIVLKPAADGKRAGEVKIRKDLIDRAKFRLLTHKVDGKQQPSGGAYYDIPLKKFTNLGGQASPPVATRPRGNAN
jgi:hypothetical protein